MLNELYQAATALERCGATTIELHPHLDPMGKNNQVLLIQLNADGMPTRLSVIREKDAGSLLRVCHGSEGAAFPGFNLPTPLRRFRFTGVEKWEKKLTEQFKTLRRKLPDVASLKRFTKKRFARSKPVELLDKQKQQAKRSLHELVGWLQGDLAQAGDELAAFKKLVEVVSAARLEPQALTEQLVNLLVKQDGDITSADAVLFAEWLFTDRKLPVYFDLAVADLSTFPVADSRTSRALNKFFLETDPPAYDRETRGKTSPAKRKKKAVSPEPPTLVRDAYTGNECSLPPKFPEPKLSVLGNTKLFSNNTGEAKCFFRYGLGDTRTFVVSPENVHRLSAAIFTLAGDDAALVALGGREASGKTCRPMPGDSKQLLVAYLEDEPSAPDPYVDVFGETAESFVGADYGEKTRPILETLDAREAKNPNARVRLFAIAEVDAANKQLRLNRSLTVHELNAAAKAWQAGAKNCPPVRLTTWDRESKRRIEKFRIVPGPMDAVLVLNQAWKTDAKEGLSAYFLESLARNDALDVFLAGPPLQIRKAQFGLTTLLLRMRPVFARAGIFKVTRRADELAWLEKRRPLSERARRDALKAVALTGIFLRILNQHHENFMKDTLYQIGQLLALADKLHFHYCKWVRTSLKDREKGQISAPTELLGNALFNAALDNPVRALARLATRIQPYKGWATTYCGESAGTARWLLGRMSDCERSITSNLEQVSTREHLDDISKAQLLLGYLADVSGDEETTTTETNNEKQL
jgi:hypothetical protein